MRISELQLNEMVRGNPGTAYWISPEGNMIDIGTTIHINPVIQSPETFNMTSDTIQAIYDKHGEKLGAEGKAREELIKTLIKKGWLRLRQYNNSHWSITMRQMTNKTFDILQQWGEYQMNRKDVSGAARDRFMDVKLTTVDRKGNLETKSSGTVKDFAEGNIMEGLVHEDYEPFTLTVVENIEDLRNKNIKKD